MINIFLPQNLILSGSFQGIAFNQNCSILSCSGLPQISHLCRSMLASISWLLIWRQCRRTTKSIISPCEILKRFICKFLRNWFCINVFFKSILILQSLGNPPVYFEIPFFCLPLVWVSSTPAFGIVSGLALSTCDNHFIMAHVDGGGCEGVKRYKTKSSFW